MKLQEHNNALETNIQGEEHDFGIGDASIVIDILRNRLYEHKIRTSVQEYLSNARDAHREIGKFDNNFEITIPTALNPTFTVRDFGPGVSPERMVNVFIRYGSSTKRADNVQTGGLGIGCKSFFSISDSFSIVTYIDGVKRHYVAHIGVSNKGRLDLISTEKTTEKNGTAISVAVKQHDIEDFRMAVHRAIHFWEQKPTLKGDLEPPVLEKGTRVSDLVEVISNDKLPEYARPRTYYNEVLALIDGIPYTINGELVSKVRKLKETVDMLSGTLVLHFGNGVVQVSASREKIDDSEFTVAALEKMAAKAYLEVKSYISDAFAKVKDTQEYLQTYATMSKDFEVDGFAKFGQYNIDRGWIESPLLKKVQMTTVSCLNRRGQRIQKVTKKYHNDNQKHISVKEFDKLFFVNQQESKVVQNKRIRAYLENNNSMILVEMLLGDQASFDEVVKDLSAKNFHDITYVDPPKAAKVPGQRIKREHASICLHILERGRFEHTTLASNTQKYFFVKLNGTQWPNGMDSSTLKELNHWLISNHNAKICGLSEKAVKQVAGDPNFSCLETWLDAYVPTKSDISVAKYSTAANDNEIHKLNMMKGLKDSFLVEMVKEYKAIGKGKSLPLIILKKAEKDPKVVAFADKDKKLTKLMKETYPLVANTSTWPEINVPELAFYCNAKYDLSREE